jgi:hypothetical protein
MDLMQKVLYGIGISAFAVLAIQLLLLLLGGDTDTDVEVDATFDGHLEHDSGLGLLSLRTVAAFFFGFGMVGAVALKAGASAGVAILAGAGVGSVLMFGVFYLMRFFYSFRHSGTLEYKNAVGATGNVYIPVPGKQSGVGQVEVMIQERLCIADAVTDFSHELPSHSRVRVTGVLDKHTLVVAPLSAETNTETT